MWSYSQRTGELFHNDELITRGYAGGNCGHNPEGINNPDMQDVPKIGPLPQGIYTLGIPMMLSHLGPFAIPLKPDAANNMFGRSGFYCHGDTSVPRCASEGCVILPRFFREMIWTSGDHKLQVVRGDGA